MQSNKSTIKWNQFRILLVDDEPDITWCFNIVLEDNGFMVDAFNDPLLALSSFKKGLYSLALIDIKMPKMNGFELSGEIRKLDEKVRISFISAFDIYKDTQSGINTYFNKAQSVKQVRAFFLNECRKLHSLVRECNVSEQNKKNTIRRMSILHAFTLTALDHLQQTEDKLVPPVDWKNVARKDMVTDMALNSNRFRTIGYMKWLSKQ